MRILVVEDDPLVTRVLGRLLSKEGYAIDHAPTGNVALDLAGQHSYDAVILDIVLPELDGLEVCKKLREMEIWSPVLMLTGRHRTKDKVEGLDAGADDYLGKPFEPPELLARLRALIRRRSTERPVVIEHDGLRLDPGAHTVARGEQTIDLGPREFAMLELLMRSAGQVLTRDELLEAVWGYNYKSNVVDVYVTYLRNKIDKPFGTSSIQTVRGIGYRFGN